MKTAPALVVEIRRQPLPGPGHIYTLYQLVVNGRVVREQISAFASDEVALANATSGRS